MKKHLRKLVVNDRVRVQETKIENLVRENKDLSLRNKMLSGENEKVHKECIENIKQVASLKRELIKNQNTVAVLIEEMKKNG